VATLTITCPQPVTAQSADGNPVTVTYGAPTASGGVAPVTVTCTVPSGTPFNPGVTNVTCAATDNRGVSSVCSFSVSVQAPPRLVGTRFMAFGDSITWGTPPPPFPTLYPIPPEPTAYPRQLEIRLAARYRLQTPSVVNEGWPGEQAADVGVPRFATALQQHNPDIVLLMEGTNDLLTRNVDRTMDALGSMVRMAKAQNRRVAIATVPPQRVNGFRVPPRDPAVIALIPVLNDRIRALAVAENIVLADVFQAMQGDLSLIGADDLHPTARGYEVIADTFLDAIRRNFEVVVPATTLR
jgi:lysophospholipase L1-like esterase